jgi:hypothetical protein
VLLEPSSASDQSVAARSIVALAIEAAMALDLSLGGGSYHVNGEALAFAEDNVSAVADLFAEAFSSADAQDLAQLGMAIDGFVSESGNAIDFVSLLGMTPSRPGILDGQQTIGAVLVDAARREQVLSSGNASIGVVIVEGNRRERIISNGRISKV